MFKINNLIFLCVVIIVINFPKIVFSNSLFIKEISDYITGLDKFSCNFIQYSPDGSISEGNMIYSKNRVRINYLQPSAITFIAREKKAMYFNEDLMELHYFNPNKTAFSLFASLFNLNQMPKDFYSIEVKNSVINLKFNEINIEQISKFSVVFQDNPLELKKIKWSSEDGESVFSIYNLDSGVEIHKKTFSMINPIINN